MSNNDMTDESDIPPLEDMSELLHQAQQLQLMKEKKEAETSVNSTRQDKLSKNKPKPSDNKPKTESKTTEPVVSKPEGRTQQESSKDVPVASKVTSKKTDSFAGMKKGFLFGAPAKTSKSRAQRSRTDKDASNQSKTMSSPKTSDDIPFIKPQGDGAQNGAQRIPEVQEALKATAPFLENKEWVTDNLLSKIEQHPRLGRQMADPRFSQAMTMFQSNPQGAMQHFQNNPDIQEFFQDFCGILGDHFSGLELTDPPPATSAPLVSPPQKVKVHDGSGADLKVASSTNPNQATAEDEARMRMIMSNPEVMKAFGHPKVRVLFEFLRTDPEKAQRMMETADPDFKQSIQKLVDAGLFGYAR